MHLRSFGSFDVRLSCAGSMFGMRLRCVCLKVVLGVFRVRVECV